jgi:hypothetical protein
MGWGAVEQIRLLKIIVFKEPGPEIRVERIKNRRFASGGFEGGVFLQAFSR